MLLSWSAAVSRTKVPEQMGGSLENVGIPDWKSLEGQRSICEQSDEGW